MSSRSTSIRQRPAGRFFHPLSLGRQIELQRRSKPRPSVLRSTRPEKYRLWDSDRLERALSDIDEGMSLRQASMEWGIPKSTLHDYCTRQNCEIAQDNPRRYFTDFEESTLADFIVRSAEIGFGRTINDVLSLANEVLATKGATTANVGRGWFDGFRKRYPNITLRKGENLSRARHACTDQTIVDNYFNFLEFVLTENTLLDKAGQIFNFDEVGMPFQHAPVRVLAERQQKHVYSISSGNKSQITVLACSAASGYVLPPFVVLKRRRPDGFAIGEVPGTVYMETNSGWSNSAVFERWFLNHFLPFAPSVRPLLLLLDGHSSHYNPAVVEKAAESGVILFCLPPNTTHLLQPLDRCAFSSLKRSWSRQCHDFTLKNSGRLITMSHFSKVFRAAWTESMTLRNIMASFSRTGVCPFDKTAVKVAPESSSKEKSPVTAPRQTISFLPLLTPSPAKLKLALTGAEGSLNQNLNTSTQHSPIPFLQASASPSVVALSSSPPLPHHDSRDKLLAETNTSEMQFTKEEETVYQRRYENGYDLEDARYSKWLQLHKLSRPTAGISSASMSSKPRQQPQWLLSIPEEARRSPQFTKEEEAVYQRRYENGYDLEDARYSKWLQLHKLSRPTAGIPSACMSSKPHQQPQWLPSIPEKARRSPSTAEAKLLTSGGMRAVLQDRLRKKEKSETKNPAVKKATRKPTAAATNSDVPIRKSTRTAKKKELSQYEYY